VSGLVLTGAAAATPGAGDSATAKSKVSSFAPHHTKSQVYGTPIARPIVHKRKRHTRPSIPAAEPPAPIK
jgi:hypothetical protein